MPTPIPPKDEDYQVKGQQLIHYSILINSRPKNLGINRVKYHGENLIKLLK